MQTTLRQEGILHKLKFDRPEPVQLTQQEIDTVITSPREVEDKADIKTGKQFSVFGHHGAGSIF